MTRLFASFALVLLSLPATAESSSIVGTWKLESFVREVQATGERKNALGEKPSGYISYQPDGRVFVVLVGDRTKPVGPAPTDAEKIKLFSTLSAYSGKYVVDGDKVTHKIDVSWNEAWTGGDQVRFAKVDGNKLAITTAVNIDPRDGREGRGMLIFTKAD
jgi:lipocalin-like protein